MSYHEDAFKKENYEDEFFEDGEQNNSSSDDSDSFKKDNEEDRKFDKQNIDALKKTVKLNFYDLIKLLEEYKELHEKDNAEFLLLMKIIRCLEKYAEKQERKREEDREEQPMLLCGSSRNTNKDEERRDSNKDQTEQGKKHVIENSLQFIAKSLLRENIDINYLKSYSDRQIKDNTKYSSQTLTRHVNDKVKIVESKNTESEKDENADKDHDSQELESAFLALQDMENKTKEKEEEESEDVLSDKLNALIEELRSIYIEMSLDDSIENPEMEIEIELELAGMPSSLLEEIMAEIVVPSQYRESGFSMPPPTKK